ncbi:hypothetical protein [Niabella beijingensis]|uniref:hypothetical protein n=1 Tax=Niabella beijingensis TaxID=2872700 RepID=UPI001CBFB036|nr:hypothetical protein [Niabella beijingensis]MBZ4192610.1 hypothetical protein [Niabella beijingensis]
MKKNIQNNRIAQQLIRNDINYAAYLSLLAVVHIWHFTALGLKRAFFKQIIYRNNMAGISNGWFVSKGYSR